MYNMVRNIYALLVGINEYISPISALKGCVNDIESIKLYLEGRVATDKTQLHILKLVNQEATYQAIVNGFRQHLCQADNDDVALFYYAGHGSQEKVPEAFRHLEPDSLEETIVCYDSRLQGGKDLADKELAALIGEVAQKNPHITVIMDCCHSGSGTREIEAETAVRQAPLDIRTRDIDSYIFSLAELEQRLATRSLDNSSSNSKTVALASGKHVFLSACRNSELAKELRVNGQSHGAFSYYLLDSLKQANGKITYRDLFKRSQALVASKVSAQFPQAEATVLEDLDQPFLGGVIEARTPYFTLSYNKDHEWVIDGGAIHNIPVPTDGETTELAIFPFDASSTQLLAISSAQGKAQVTQVLPQLSKVTISGIATLNPDMTFKAVITSLPLPPKKVYLTGEEKGIQHVHDALLSSPLYVKEVSTTEAAEFKVLARDNQYWISRIADDRPLVAQINEYNETTASQVVQRLEHIARWTKIVELSSSAASQIQSNDVLLQIYQNDKEILSSQIRLEYRQENGKSIQPNFKIKLKNTSSKALYCALLDLNDRFAVTASLFEGGGIWLNPGEEAWALGNKPIYPSVPKELWQQGITETTDILKLIVSTSEFDAKLLEQVALDAPSIGTRSVSKGKGTLNHLMRRVLSRDLSAEPEGASQDDWVTTQTIITTVRPQPSTPISNGNQTAILGMGVTISPHPSLKANARLSTVTQSTRDLSNHLLPPLLRTDQENIQPFQFTTSRGNDPGLSVLELNQISDGASVTPAEPLKISVEAPLNQNEEVLAIGYNGEFYLPLGYAQSKADGTTEIVIERLPEPVSEGTRSLGGAIRIFFQKIAAKILGATFEYPLLTVANVEAQRVNVNKLLIESATDMDIKVTYVKDTNQVKAKVAKASKIAIYVHGIIGDTQSMVGSVALGEFADQYDLILAFDYENLNTTIEENGRLLKQRLGAVGITEESGKIVHLIAHSMGGLVSRWFVEHEGGNKIVQHLTMLGTPNAGSNWSSLYDWATVTLTLGLNSFTVMTWGSPINLVLTQVIKCGFKGFDIIDNSFEQMQPGSKFLNTLATGVNPGIPYTIIAGNTSIIPEAPEPDTTKPSRLERLMQALFNKATNIAFFSEPNDIAVTIESIKSVKWNTSPQPTVYEIACDHLTYFTTPIGWTTLATTIKQAFKLTGEITTPTPTIPISKPQLAKPKTPILDWVFGIISISLIAILIRWLLSGN
jgi:Caspase domain